MKALKFAGLVLIALIFTARAQAQSLEAQTLTVPLSEPGKPYKIDVHLVTGSIKITGYDGKDVVIEAMAMARQKTDRGDKNEKTGMHRISAGGDNLDIIAEEKNNIVTVGSGMPNKTVMLNIKIPQSATSVKLYTTNNGNIVAENISSDFEVGNTNGSISLNNVSGSVVANTTNGSVKVNMKSIDPKAAMAFTSLNGTVDITFPASLKANVKARSDRGEVYTDFDVAIDKSAPKATKTAEKGLYHISVEDWVNGKINGGGPEMLFKTMNGNIYIRKAK